MQKRFLIFFLLTLSFVVLSATPVLFLCTTVGDKVTPDNLPFVIVLFEATFISFFAFLFVRLVNLKRKIHDKPTGTKSCQKIFTTLIILAGLGFLSWFVISSFDRKVLILGLIVIYIIFRFYRHLKSIGSGWTSPEKVDTEIK